MNSGRRTARQEEEYHVKRRNDELRKQEHLNSVAQYFKSWDVKNTKYAAWTSQKYFQQSQEARLEAEKKEKKVQSLNERRSRLKALLEREQKIYEVELRKYRGNRSSWMPLEELKTVNLELKRRSEESRKREAELLQYQRWKQEQPTLRDIERRQQLEFMKKSWIDQVKEREAEREKRKAEEELRAKEEELKRKEEEELEKIRKKTKEEELKTLKEEIKHQMEAVKESVNKYKELERLEAEERMLQSQIEEMIAQRKLAAQKKANTHLVSFWTRQYQLKLQKKAKEMEEEIFHDQKMLERLKEELKQETKAQRQIRDLAKAEMELALKELHTQRQREALRQKEYEHMFYEEAKRAWDAQERRWAQEQQARDQLMGDVLKTVKKQVEEKAEERSKVRVAVLQEREVLLKQLNHLYDEWNRHEVDARMSQEQFRRDLDDQVAEKMLEQTRKAQEEQDLLRVRSLAEKENEEKLAKEMEKIQINMCNKPPNFRRQRVIW